jgi:DNA-binding FadR family transcriptional regulator
MARLHREVMRLLIGEIASGRLAPGELLPPEAELAAQRGVSRGVLRECVRGLEERGMVTVKHGRGATVTPSEQWDMFDPDVLAAMLTGQHGTRVLRQYLECREVLEVAAAGFAAERATAEHLAALADAFVALAASADRARSNPAAEALYREADVAFHRAIIDAAENAALGRMTEPVHRALQTALPALARPEQRFERSLPEHKRILAAIVGRDPEGARAAMRKHLATIEDYLRDYAAEHGELGAQHQPFADIK